MLEKFPSKLKSARESKKISQNKLGMLLGLSDKAISAYESGRTYPPLDTLARISQELGKPISYFLTDDPREASLMNRIDKLSFEIKDFSKELEEIRKHFLKENKAKKTLPPIAPEN